MSEDRAASPMARARQGIEQAREALGELRLQTAIMRDSILTQPEQLARIEAQMWWEAKCE